jgi:hypothetical protein
LIPQSLLKRRMAIDAIRPAPRAATAHGFLPRSERWKVIAYIGVLVMLLGFGAPFGGLIDVPVSFMLKNKMHLSASDVARFRLVAGIPLYLSFVFGFARDIWNPFGMKDRGFLVLFGAICAGIYLFYAFAPLQYLTLLVASVLLTTAFLFVSSAQVGLTGTIGQKRLMWGQITVAWKMFGSIPILAAFLLGGQLSGLLEMKSADQAVRILFLIGAAIMLTVAVYGAWKPAGIFANVGEDRVAGESMVTILKRLVTHWPIYPALLIYLLWNFAPGYQTPLQFYLQNSLHASDAQWGEWNAIFTVSYFPTFITFGILCRKYPLRRLLFWGTIIAVPQMVPLVFIHSVPGALIAAVPIGLTGGIASAAYIDLLIRSCPAGLQGTILMMAGSLLYMISRAGDLLGTVLYERYQNFDICVVAITVVYALILPALRLVPPNLTATPDGTELQVQA